MQILLFKNCSRTKLLFLFPCLIHVLRRLTPWPISLFLSPSASKTQPSSLRPPPRPQETSTRTASARTRERDLSKSNALFLVFFSVSLVLPAIPSKVQPRRSRSLRRALPLGFSELVGSPGAREPGARAIRGGTNSISPWCWCRIEFLRCASLRTCSFLLVMYAILLLLPNVLTGRVHQSYVGFLD